MASMSGWRVRFLVWAAALLVPVGCNGKSTTSPLAPTVLPAASDPVRVAGLVGPVSGTCPSISFTAGNQAVATNEATVFPAGGCAAIKRGSVIAAEGRRPGIGVVVATKVELEDGGTTAGLLSEVAGGGYVLFFRHAERNSAAISTADLGVADNAGACLPGSELTANGRADAAALGERFARYGIKVEKVYISPTCRTTQMAQLAFGSFEATRALTWPGMWAPGEGAQLAPGLRQLLGTPPAPGSITVLIAHNDVLQADRVGVAISLDQAEAAVFRPLGGERFEFLGKIPKAEWMGQP